MITPYWAGVLSGPFILAGGAYCIHRAILTYRWLKKVLKGHGVAQWPALIAVSWGLPRLTHEYCLFRQLDGRFWFSPRTEKFRVLKTPEDLGQ